MLPLLHIFFIFQSKLHYDYIKLWLADSEYDAIIPADEVVNHGTYLLRSFGEQIVEQPKGT